MHESAHGSDVFPGSECGGTQRGKERGRGREGVTTVVHWAAEGKGRVMATAGNPAVGWSWAFPPAWGWYRNGGRYSGGLGERNTTVRVAAARLYKRNRNARKSAADYHSRNRLPDSIDRREHVDSGAPLEIEKLR